MGKKITYEIIREYINNENGNGCKLLTTKEQFEEEKLKQGKINTRVELKIQCKCGNKFNIGFYKFKDRNQKQCKDCGNKLKGNSKTFNDFITFLNDNYKNEYEVIGDFVNYSTKVIMKHNICNHEWSIKPATFVFGHTCPKCAGNIKMNAENFKEKVMKIHGDKYEILEDFIDNMTPVLIRHNLCGNEFTIKPKSFLNNNLHCPKCDKKAFLERNLKTQEEFEKEVYDLVSNEYTVIGKYIKSDTIITLKHNTCGNEWNVTPNNFLTGCRCGFCSGKIRKTTKQFKNEIFEIVGKEYELMDEYINCQTNIKIKHNICNNIYEVTPSSFLAGCRCPVCNESKGEQSVRHYLENNDIKFSSQYSFNDLYGDYKLLKFDFIVLNKNEKINCLIEYDGIFHYKPVKLYKNEPNELGEERFKKQQKYDQLKNDYCKLHKIKLIRIPYWEFDNIEKILDKELNINIFANKEIIKNSNENLKEVM